MELDFDKEIDAILRKAHRDGPVLIGDYANATHLDADEISAFAENAMPENSRALYSAHLAECDRCRNILSNLLVMNAEAAPVGLKPAVAIAEASTPWYRKLFLFPNLAYVLGGLVLIFGGFLGFTIVQNSGVADSGMVSQSSEPATAQSGPYFDSEESFTANVDTGASANASANTAPPVSNMTANANAATPLEKNTKEARAGSNENNLVADGTTTDVVVTGAPVAGAPVPPPLTVTSDQPRAREADVAKAKAEDKGYSMQESAKKDVSAPRPQSPGALSSTQSGPMQNNQSQYNRQLENMDSAASSKNKRSGRRDEESSSGRKVVSGKTFERKQGVWYDTSYQNQPTINVRRRTDEFNRLDAGLRSIANSLGGTAVIVWGAKAYRIQ